MYYVLKGFLYPMKQFLQDFFELFRKLSAGLVIIVGDDSSCQSYFIPSIEILKIHVLP